jgi:hypothetical protein
MKTRTDLLNHLVEKYNLRKYLEIGVQDPAQNFDKIKCFYKFSVDPDPKANATLCKTSDEFFVDTGLPTEFFDLIFIDGLHTSEQVKKDFENALTILSPNGFIVLHDCNPLKEEHTIVPRPTKTGHWNGDVYKFAMQLAIDKYTIDIDNGCMVVPYSREFIIQGHSSWDWNYFDKHREDMLNLISWEQMIMLNK